MKKREAVRTILRMGGCNVGDINTPDYVLCDDCPFQDGCESPNYSLQYAQEWWGEHKGKDFTKHYKVGDWLYCDTGNSLVTDVQPMQLKIINIEHPGEYTGFVPDSIPFWPVYPKEFITEVSKAPVEGKKGFWEYISPNSQYRTIVYGHITQGMGWEAGKIEGYIVHTTLNESGFLPGAYHRGFAVETSYDPGYVPVTLTVK